MIIRIITVSLLLSLFSCYSFKGISIPPTADYFFVEDFGIAVRNAPSDINQRFAEALRRKIINESRLKYSEDNADLIFSGNITGYQVNSIAPEEGNTTALNRLEIRVKVDFTNTDNPDEDWSNTFSFFQDYDSNADLQSLEEGLVEIIFRQLVEDVFNKAFTNW